MTQPATTHNPQASSQASSPVFHKGVDDGHAIQIGLFEGFALPYRKDLFSDKDYFMGLFTGRAQRIEEHHLAQLGNPAVQASMSTRDATITAISEPGRTLTLSLHRHHDRNTFDFELRVDGRVACASFFDTGDLSMHHGSMLVAAQMILAECVEAAQMIAWPEAYDHGDLETAVWQLYDEDHKHVLASLASRPGDPARASELVALDAALDEVDWTTDPAIRIAQVRTDGE